MIILLEGPGHEDRFKAAFALGTRLDLPQTFIDALDRPSWPVSPQRLMAALEEAEGRPGTTIILGGIVDIAAREEWSGYRETAAAVDRAITLARFAARLGAVRITMLSTDIPMIARAAAAEADAIMARFIPSLRLNDPNWTATAYRSVGAMEDFARDNAAPAAARRLKEFIPRGSTGSCVPKLILVGAGLEAGHWAGLPFSGGTATTWFNRALLQFGPQNLQHYILNAEKEPLAEMLLVRRLGGGCPVVALGQAAHSWLKREHIDHSYLRSPAWHARFRNTAAHKFAGKLVGLQGGKASVLMEARR